MLKKIALSVVLIMGLTSFSFADNDNILGITEYNSLSPIETKQLGEISPQTKAYLDKEINKKINEIYNTRIKKQIEDYLKLVSNELTEKQKQELKKIVYDLKQEDKKIISQNRLLLKRYNYLLKKYKEAHIVTAEDLKRLMIGEAKEIHDNVIYEKTIKSKNKKININGIFE